ncbi:prenyltransferase [Pseudonocardia humida]|uniref:prenyltransferase n=1 Tax=Pseudonocardia humida TaxID=2800819 RepID=UPI00207C8D64|nr:prenyltransferase [Pseudonocardia humida]
MSRLPSVGGVFSEQRCRRTAAAIAAVQQPSGALPWFTGGRTDPWDHVQAAMALSATGLREQADAAFEWTRTAQRPDGSWAAEYRGDAVVDEYTDANFCAYPATGVWHHWRVFGDRGFVERMWPTVRRGIDVVLGLRAPGGQVWWARDVDGSIRREALLTGNASIHLSLRCAIGLAEVVGEAVPELELAADGVRHSLDGHPERYADKSRYSMDWYYPVLGGALPVPVARARLAAHRAEFVVDGLGIRCVADRPWVTGAETCEYVLALDAAGLTAEAHAQFAAMQHLRDPDGSYWTGLVYPDRARWPVERSTWTAATVVLAADALSRTTAGNGLFRGEGLPPGTMSPTLEGTCRCPTSR